MSIEELLTKIMEMDLNQLSAFIAANAALLKSLGADKVVQELLIPWFKENVMSEEQQNKIIEQVGRVIELSAENTLGLKSVATYSVDG